MDFKMVANTIRNILFKNRYTREGLIADRDVVNLEYFRDSVNLGDQLSKVICEYMLSLHDLSLLSPAEKQYTHMTAIGSLSGGRGFFDATVWETGIRSFSEIAFWDSIAEFRNWTSERFAVRLRA